MAVSSITLEIDLDDAKARKALDDFNKAMAKASGQQPQTEKERLREESSALQLEALERRRQQRQEQSNRENIRYQRESIRTQIEQNRLTEAHGRLESQTNKQRSRDEEEEIATNLKRASRIKEISTPMIQGMGQVGMSFLSPSASSIVSGLSGAIGGTGQMMQ